MRNLVLATTTWLIVISVGAMFIALVFSIHMICFKMLIIFLEKVL